MIPILREPSAAQRAAASLLATDRCDRCKAAAQVRVNTKAGPLDFCGHHYSMYAEALAESGVSVYVDRRSSPHAPEEGR